MGSWTKMIAVIAAAVVLTGCQAANPVQRDAGPVAQLQLTNRTAQPLELEVVAGTTTGEMRQAEVSVHVSLAAGEATAINTYPGRYTIFPQRANVVGARSLAFETIELKETGLANVQITEVQKQTVAGNARHLVFETR